MARTRAIRARPWLPSLLWYTTLRQTIDAGRQGLFAVLVEEELGVGQAGTHHALVAANHHAARQPG